MQYIHAVLCVIIATFVLMSDHPKIATASPTVQRNTREVNKYTTKYDNIDVDRILQSNRLLLSYVNCLLEKGPCTPEGRELKKYVPDALSTECSKCSAAQRKIAGKVFSVLLQNHRPYWDQLIAKYDPNAVFRTKYEIDQEDEDYSDLEEAK